MENLDKVIEKGKEKYLNLITNQDILIPIFKFSLEVGKVIYTQ